MPSEKTGNEYRIRINTEMFQQIIQWITCTDKIHYLVLVADDKDPNYIKGRLGDYYAYYKRIRLFISNHLRGVTSAAQLKKTLDNTLAHEFGHCVADYIPDYPFVRTHNKCDEILKLPLLKLFKKLQISRFSIILLTVLIIFSGFNYILFVLAITLLALWSWLAFLVVSFEVLMEKSADQSGAQIIRDYPEVFAKIIEVT